MAEETTQDKPETKPAAKKSKGQEPLQIESKYTLKALDESVGDLEEYEHHRAETVDDQLAFLEALLDPMESRLESTVFEWMRDPSKNPYRSSQMALPKNLSEISLQDLQDRLGTALNALYLYTEVRASVNAVAQSRSNLLERRKHHALVNEGRNEQERKGLSYLRADPEMMLYNRIQMAKEWVEPRYFTLGRMVDALTDAIKTKSVEASREQKDRQADWNQQ